MLKIYYKGSGSFCSNLPGKFDSDINGVKCSSSRVSPAGDAGPRHWYLDLDREKILPSSSHRKSKQNKTNLKIDKQFANLNFIVLLRQQDDKFVNDPK